MTTRTQQAQNSTTQTITTTNETVVLTFPGISSSSSQDTVAVQGSLDITAGTAATFVTVRVRRGTGITGTVAGNSDPITVTAGATSNIGFDVADNPGEVAGQPYVVTVQQTAATGNGSVLHAEGQITLLP